MKIAIIGLGGREHALGKKCKQEGHTMYFFPGNPGTAELGTNIEVNLKVFSDIDYHLRRNEIIFTIIGPEDPLNEGIVDYLEEMDHVVFGPRQKAALLESSKIYARGVNDIFNIPQPSSIFCDTDKEAWAAAEKFGFPCVFKADGLAAGKGVSICHNQQDVIQAIKDMFGPTRKFGKDGDSILVEEFLAGDEISVFVVCDANGDYKIIGTAEDYKKLGDGDTGPNTGSMGAFAPSVLATPELMSEVELTIIQPLLKGMQNMGTPYCGCLYISLMLVEGKPFVIEYNVRFGDPETQVILPLISSSISELLYHAATNRLKEIPEIDESGGAAVVVVKAMEGYPGSYSKGHTVEISINGFNDDSYIIHAGTKKSDYRIVTNGGRVLNGVGLGANLQLAIDNAYSAINLADFSESYFRKDIGQKGLKYLEAHKS